MKNLRKISKQPCCYYCIYWFGTGFGDKHYSLCNHPDVIDLDIKESNVLQVTVCDNYEYFNDEMFKRGLK